MYQNNIDSMSILNMFLRNCTEISSQLVAKVERKVASISDVKKGKKN